MPLRPNEILIDDDTPSDVLFPAAFGRGAVPRDYATHPPEMFAPPSDIPLRHRSEWSDRIKEKEREKSNLSDLRGSVPSLDQNGQGFCWAYSVAATVIVQRMAAGLPYVRLSAHAVACKIKGFRDEGGWCGLSAQFARETGYPSVAAWPEKSMARQYDTPATWADAAKHRITEDWVDLTRPVYGQNLTFDMLVSLLLSNVPCAVDFNWWGHSVCAVDAVEVEPGSFGIRIWNSWADSWGDRGMGVLRGSKAVPDGAVATRTVTPSAA